MKREVGIIYYLHNFTAPKVYTGLYFWCLLTDQKIPSHTKVVKDTGIHIKDWEHEIYKPERFNLNEGENKRKEVCDHDCRHISQGVHKPVYCENCGEEL